LKPLTLVLNDERKIGQEVLQIDEALDLMKNLGSENMSKIRLQFPRINMFGKFYKEESEEEDSQNDEERTLIEHVLTEEKIDKESDPILYQCLTIANDIIKENEFKFY
jgi:hypothetical protein